MKRAWEKSQALFDLQRSREMKQLKTYVPRTRQDAKRLSAVLLCCAVVVWWMWTDLMMAWAYWKISLVLIVLVVVIIASKMTRLDRQHDQVLKVIQASKKGVTRAELATKLKESKPERLDSVIGYLLEHEKVVWRQDGAHLLLCVR